MHHGFELNIDGISKTEGHAGLEIKVRNNKVEEVKLKVSENKRFFTQAVRGKKFYEVPNFLSRICGTCSIAHVLASIEAIERALGIEISHQTIVLRRLLMFGLIIRDHAMHLYFLSLPDVFKKDSIIELLEKKPEIVRDAFEIKAAGNSISKLVGGRAIHPYLCTIGGFLKIPKEEEIRKTLKELKAIREKIFPLLEIFYDSNLSFENETNYVALCTPSFDFLEGEIRSSDGLIIPEDRFWDFVNRVVLPYSQSTAFQFSGKPYRVGALARINLNSKALDEDTKKDVKIYLKKFPSHNIFYNNLAQGIEILHSIDASIKILEGYDFKEERIKEIKVKEGEGVGVVEAPRGTLYHMVYLDSEGKVRFMNLVIPTAQNQIQMELDIRDLVQKNLGKRKHSIQHKVEALIRAYDPCFSCASHFLKVRWV
ncbi:MAG: Ni/Fe hydrogenase subunit alpha [Candidatus Aenigmatarchaeota archaeon]